MHAGQSKSWFTRFAKNTSHLVGRPVSFTIASAIVLSWAIAGPFFQFSNSWQMVINSTTTIITFLIVFLIQNTQSRDSEAIQIKLDELIRVTKGAHSALMDLEELEDKELDQMHRHYEELARKAREELRSGKHDTGEPKVKV